jgi:hypothetical protein
MVHSDNTDKATHTESKPIRLLPFRGLGSSSARQLGVSGCSSTPEIEPDKVVTRERDGKTQAGMMGRKATPFKTVGTVKRIWRSLVRRT